MKEDITPSLIESVNKSFESNYNSSPQIAKLLEKDSKTYKDAYRYAEQVGQARALSYMEITSDDLPDGRMYYNIASRLMQDTLGADQQMIAEYAQTAQQKINEKTGLNLKAQKADLNQDRIDGFVNRISSEEDFDSVSWILKEPVKTFARSVVDDTVKKNAEFQDKAGVKATVSREAAFNCCPWCLDVAGEYTYPRVPREVFGRHDNCRCTLDYEGRRLSAYEKNGKAHSFRDLGEQERMEERKKYAVERTNKNGIIRLSSASERSRSHKMHNEKYGEGALLVNEKYIVSDEYKNKFVGITGNESVDNALYEHSMSILRDRSGTKKETLVLLDKSNGNPILTIKSNKDNGISYSDKDIEVISQAKDKGIEIIGIHNHPTGYPPTADDCVSAMTRGYDFGVTSGHNGTVHIYYPSEVFYSEEECEEIHRIIAEECKYKTNVDDVLTVWEKDLKDLGMTIKERR